MSASYPLFVRRDLDGFFGLFIDNLVQLLLIMGLCAGLCGMTGEAAGLLTARILPGAAVSILAGNLFYAWQARRLAKRTGRSDVTALPYGINTPSLLVYVFFVMAPTYGKLRSGGADELTAATMAWELGLIACLGSGIIELLGALVAGRVRAATPRAALLSTLAGIAVGFISMTFALQIFNKPLVAMAPLAIVLLTYFSKVTFPLGLPGGFVAVAVGTAIAWSLTGLISVWPGVPAWVAGSAMPTGKLAGALSAAAWTWPQPAVDSLWKLLQQPETWLVHLSVIVPMGLFNLIGSLQNIESAEAEGDAYNTTSSLAANGVGTILAACFGSCFPTTIYIGHPGWKALGARAGYSTLNGLVITALCLTNTVGVVQALVPIEAGVAIVLWIGIIITAQAFSASGVAHAPAVAVGLFPAIAAFSQTVAAGAFIAAGGKTMQDVLTANGGAELNGFLLHGMLTIERGYIFTCMILAALSANLIDGRFRSAAIWALIGAGCAALGLTHAYQLAGNNLDFLFTGTTAAAGALEYRAWPIAIGYVMVAGLLSLFSDQRQAKIAKP